jgi:hypothetical protein
MPCPTYATQGTELCLSYADTEGSANARRDELRDHYGFECACERCKADFEVSSSRRIFLCSICIVMFV